MSDTTMTYRDIMNDIEELNKDIKENCIEDEKVYNQDPIIEISNLLKLYREFENSADTLQDNNKLLDIQEEMATVVMRLSEKVNENIAALIQKTNDTDSQKQEIICNMEKLKKECAITYFKIALLQNIFRIKTEIIDENYTSNLDYYNYHIESQIRKKELDISFKKLDEYVQAHNEMLINPVKELFKKFDNHDVKIRIVKNKQNAKQAYIQMVVNKYIFINIGHVLPKRVSLAYLKDCYGIKEEYTDEVMIRNAIIAKGDFDIDISKNVNEKCDETNREFVEKLVSVLKESREEIDRRMKNR